MGSLTGKHKTVGYELTKAEFESADSHDLVVSGAANHDILEMNASGVPTSTNTPSVQKIQIGGTAGTPTYELDHKTGTANFAFGTTLSIAGAVSGNAGRHGQTSVEYMHFPLSEGASATIISDKNSHFTGTISGTNSVTADTSGLPGSFQNTMVFDGTNYGTIANNDLSDWNEISVSLWVKIPSSNTAATTQYIFGNDNGNAPGAQGISVAYFSGTSLAVYHGTAGMVAFAVSKDTWYHVVGSIKSGGKISATVNGVYKQTTPSSALTIQTNKPWRIATQPSYPQYSFSGSIADIRIYNKILQKGEIEFLYNGGNGTQEPLRIQTNGSSKNWTEVSNYQTTAPSNTYQFTATDSRLVAGVGLRYQYNSNLYYGMVVSNVAGTVSIAGAPLSTSYPIQALWIGTPECLHIERFQIHGGYNSGKSVGYVFENRIWRKSLACCVGVFATHTTADSGTQINIKLNDSSTGASTLGSGYGVAPVTTGWVPSVATDLVSISTANYVIDFGQNENLVLTATGSGTAQNLSVEAIYIIK